MGLVLSSAGKFVNLKVDIKKSDCTSMNSLGKIIFGDCFDIIISASVDGIV